MSAIVNLAVSVGAYGYFFWALPLQASAFMINLGELVPDLASLFPYGIDNNPIRQADPVARVVSNVALLGLFAIPHSILARKAVKKLLGGDDSKGLYRSLYVLQSSAALHTVLHFWQPLEANGAAPLWSTSSGSTMQKVALAGYLGGWLWLVSSTFAIDHFQLFGLAQGLGIDFMAKLGLKAAAAGEEGELVVRAHYAVVRHPIMTGFFTMFFCVPAMTKSHLFFSAGCSAYILLAVKLLEEPDLREMHPEYTEYERRVPNMYCPWPGVSNKKKDE